MSGRGRVRPLAPRHAVVQPEASSRLLADIRRDQREILDVLTGVQAEVIRLADAARADPSEPWLMSIREAASKLGVSEDTVERLVRDGTLRSGPIGTRRLVEVAGMRRLVAELLEAGRRP